MPPVSCTWLVRVPGLHSVFELLCVCFRFVPCCQYSITSTDGHFILLKQKSESDAMPWDDADMGDWNESTSVWSSAGGFKQPRRPPPHVRWRERYIPVVVAVIPLSPVCVFNSCSSTQW